MASGGRPPSPPPKKKRSSSRLAAGDDMKQSEDSGGDDAAAKVVAALATLLKPISTMNRSATSAKVTTASSGKWRSTTSASGTSIPEAIPIHDDGDRADQGGCFAW
ncbi:uncharacterized protein LOC120684319 [Panicum virgatum]|uniref:uncharacterized protein LOC120684319 n=1 Tax=Panicum virgatum TaxID=38727 RepID=UPI0019D54CE0|nr:uncharacterized protein LOC120684319 [Panicum virgatum]